MRIGAGMLAGLAGVALIGGGGGSATAADPIPQERLAAIETYLDSVHEELGYPGLAYTLIQDGAPVLTTAIGVADATGRPVTPQTPFLLASTSKALTALAVMRLVEDGRLDLDAPVQAVLPWFTLADPDAAATITPRHLLHHTSGLSEASGTAYQRSDDQDADALERGVRRLADEPLEAAPGERFIYSNTNYDILGLLVQTITGMPFDEAMASLVYQPLGMAHAHATTEAARADGASEGFYPWFGSDWRPIRVPTPRTGAPSATTFASVEDLGKELLFHLGDGTVDGFRVVSAETLATLHRPGVVIDDLAAYAMGWSVRPYWEWTDPSAQTDAGTTMPTLLEHEGTWANGRSYVAMVPSEKLGFAFLLNGVDPTIGSVADRVAWSLVRLLAGRDPWDPVPTEDWLSQNSRLVALGISVAEVVSFLLSLAWIARLQRRHAAPRTGRMVVALIAAGALDLLVTYLLLVLIPDRYGVTVPALITFVPDIALGAYLALALALIWGPIRTIIVLTIWLRRRRRSMSSAPVAAPA